MPVLFSACRRQISDSTLCVNITAGQGSCFGRFTAGNRKSQTMRSNVCVSSSAFRRSLNSRERYLPTA